MQRTAPALMPKPLEHGNTTEPTQYAHLEVAMSGGIQTDVVIPQQLFGSTACAVTVRVTSRSSRTFDRVSVEPVVLCGKLLVPESTAEDSGTSELLALRRRIIAEIEQQVVRAYERDQMRNLSLLERLIAAYASAGNMYISLFTSKLSGPRVPMWATEALRIQEWEDVERLEADVISKEKEASFLRKAFEINKDKLRRCMNRIASEDAKSQEQELTPGDELAPGASLSYPFALRLPHLIRARELDLEFRVTYRDRENEQFTQRSVGRRANILPSAFAVPTGGLLGAACGYGIRATLRSSAADAMSFDWWSLGGSVLLGLLFTLVTARKAQGKQPIVVEDMVGGFIIGALTGLFSEEVLQKLALLVK